MASDKVEVQGIVTEICKGGQFRVTVDAGGKEMHILAYASGKMRKHMIKIVVGDEVSVEVTPYDLTRGRIVYRPR